MSNMANIVIKKADGTTNVTWSAQTPSAGDKTPARWASLTVAGAPNGQPTFSMKTRQNAQGTYRHCDFKMSFPISYTDPVTGRVVVTDVMNATVGFSLPAGVTDSQVQEAFAQLGNLLSATLIRTAVQERYAPQ